MTARTQWPKKPPVKGAHLYKHGMSGTSGDYEPQNCRWATRKEQATNRPTFVNLIEFRGETKTITDWAAQVGVHQTSLRQRIQAWGLERAITTPKMRHRPDHA